MDVETSVIIERIERRLDTLESSLCGEIGALRDELRGEMGALRIELREEIAESRRHSDIKYESLHDDIRLIAEGLAMLTVKVDALQR